MPHGPKPLVSVCLISYNQRDYISTALDSILAQETAFPVEVVVGDDASVDGTRELALQYQTRRPDIVRVLPAAERRGIAGNIRTTLDACTGEYVAMLEGDDYWTSTDKLQRQVNALEARPDFALCFHPVQVRRDSDRPGDQRLLPGCAPGTFQLEDILDGNFIPTGSVLFRRSAYPGLPAWLDGQRLIDWPLFVLIGLSGPLLMLPEVMGVYRVHEGGVWSTRPPWENRLEMAYAIENVLRTVPLARRQRAIARNALARRLLALAWDFVDRDPPRARGYSRRSLSVYSSPELIGAQAFALVASHWPWLAAQLRRARKGFRKRGGAAP